MTATRRRTSSALCLCAWLSAPALVAPRAAAAEPPGLPLPEAPVRLHVPDVAAFDQALTGRFREALSGTLDAGDPVGNAWRRTQVGSKLEAQWSRFAADLPWSWTELRRLQPRSLALALVDVSHLEAVLVLDTPLAALPDALPAGETRTHNGAEYRVVAPGAADGSSDTERRMGLAYARAGGHLFLATSARALTAALDAEQKGRRFAAPLAGLIGLELDLDALREDRYFRREFLFGNGPESGRVRAALRLEQGRLVELREGVGAAQPTAAAFEWPAAAATGWEPDAAGLGRVLRAGLLEPLPALSDRPVPALGALPPVSPGGAEDPYLVSLERPATLPGAPAAEEGELAEWRALLAHQTVEGWGFALDADGTRRLVFAWPEARQAELETLCRRTLERRAGRARVVPALGAREIQIGPGLPALALKRTGAYVWLGPSARALADAPTPRPGGDLVRWGHLDLDSLRREGARWEHVEGSASPERVRPFADRILGLLGWIPETRTLSVERRRTPQGWSERITFNTK